MIDFDKRISELEAIRNGLIAESIDHQKATNAKLNQLQAMINRLNAENNQHAEERERERLRVEGAIRELRALQLRQERADGNA